MQKLVSQIWYLALADLQQRYIATRLGFLWAIIQPTVVFGVFWFVSVYGLRIGTGGEGPPYFAILFCGLLPWMTLSDAVSRTAGSLRVHRHLIMERAASPIAVVTSSALAATIMHLPLFTIVATIFIFAGIPVTFSWMAIAYYMVCLASLCFATGCFVAPLAARNADVAQVINTALTIWFWSSPVIWPAAVVPPAILTYLRINPFFYIIEGYRGALLFQNPFTANFTYDILFWLTVCTIFLTGLWLLHISEGRLQEWLQR